MINTDFFAGPENVAGLMLRPWTMTTRNAMAALDLVGESADAEAQILSVAWMQSQEPEDVESAVRDGSIKDKIAAFTRSFPMAAFGPVAAWAGRQGRAVSEAMVDIIPRSSGGSTENPPPN